jgi:cellulose synthase/poly-beta-1,6-N-acetylglucosamine synthase-like glycosyltransferase
LFVFHLVLFVAQVILLVIVLYLLLLTVAAFAAPKVRTDREPARRSKFAFLIPAHNEEQVLPNLLESIKHSSYPASHYDVHVIADNCSDQTAVVAEGQGALVHRRFNDRQIGKGYALKWGLAEICETGHDYDAFIVVDADSTISSNFLEVMNREVNDGAKVLQAYYSVKDPDQSWNISLRYAAFAVLHFLRPQGRKLLGGSAGLKGNGMVFAPEIVTQFPWPASITEDIDHHMLLLLNGYPVRFVAEASVLAEMPESFSQSQSQLDRWEYGRLEMAQKYIPQLLKAAGAAFQQRNFRRVYALLDAVMEHLIPPFSLMAISTLALGLLDISLLVAAHQLPSLSETLRVAWTNAILGCVLLAGQAVYLFAGLKLAQAPGVIYRRLLFAPVFIVMKVGQILRLIRGNKPDGWVKTVRNQS